MIEINASRQAKHIVDYYSYFKKIMGHKVSVFFPVAKTSLYKGTDDNFDYNEFPDLEDKYLVFNVINYSVRTGNAILDDFLSEDPHMFVSSIEEIPNDSKVVIETPQGNKSYTAKLALGYQGTGGKIVYKIKLHPRSF